MKLPTCLWMLGAGVFLSITSTHAQRSENIIDLNAEFNENGDLVVTADKKWIGTFSLAIDFVNATNLAVPPRYRTAIRSSGPVITLKNRGSYISTQCGLRCMFSLGDWRARPDRSFVYRLPYSPSLGDVRVSYPPQAPPNTTAFRASLRGNPLVYRFMLNRGDSIYAVRKGLVVIIGDQNAQESKYGVIANKGINYVVVEHQDGLYAVYYGFTRGTIGVQVGETVFPDTPLGCAGAIDSTHYAVDVRLCHLAGRIFEKGNTYTYEKAFEMIDLDPLFSTSEGEQKLNSGKSYQAVLTEELVSQEMTKREKKAREAK